MGNSRGSVSQPRLPSKFSPKKSKGTPATSRQPSHGPKSGTKESQKLPQNLVSEKYKVDLDKFDPQTIDHPSHKAISRGMIDPLEGSMLRQSSCDQNSARK